MGDVDGITFGIRAKLNLGVGLVVLISALAFGSVYALFERAIILAEKHEHLNHVSSMVKLSIEGKHPEVLRQHIREFNRHLTQATGAQHHIRIEHANGQILVRSDDSSSVARTEIEDAGLWGSLFPASIIGETTIQMGLNEASARLIVEESLEQLPDDLLASFAWHVAFASVLFGLAALCTTLLTHVLIVRPVRELAHFSERLGHGGSWETYSPTVRRRDEIGILCDRFAELSRRLRCVVRDERYSSAHLVAVGIERGLEEPLRHARMELAMLEASMPAGSDEHHHCTNLAGHLEEVVALGRRLKQIGDHPGPTDVRP